MLSSGPSQPPPADLQRYLRQQLGLNESALALGLAQAQLEQAPLPVVLWRYGLINLQQLEQVLQWQDANL